MREILFKAKTIKGMWEYGDIVQKHNKVYIHFYDHNGFECMYEVIPETVCQYTDLQDKNGKKIFESDICKVTIYDRWTNKPISECNCLVVFEEFKIGVRHGTKNEVISFDGFKNTTFELIGNVHDRSDNDVLL